MNPWNSLRGLPRELWILFAVTVINRCGMMALPFLALYLSKALGYSAAEAGLVISFYGIGSMISSPLSGRLVDVIGAPAVMKLSLFATGVVLSCFPLVHDLYGIIGLTSVWSMVSEAFRPASLVVVSDFTTSENRKAGFALNRLGINLGMSVGPTMGGFLVMMNYESIFWVNGLVAIAAGIVLVLNPMQKIFHEATSSGFEDILSAAKDRRLLFFMLALTPVIIVFFQNDAAMPLYLVQEVGIAESTFGLLFLVNTAIIIVLEVPLNLGMAEWSHARALALGSLLVGLGYGALAVTFTLPVAILTFVIWTFGEMILFPTSAAYAAEISPPAKRGVYMGFYSWTFSVSFAVGPWLGTYVFEQAGWTVVWVGTLLVSAVAALMMLRMK